MQTRGVQAAVNHVGVEQVNNTQLQLLENLFITNVYYS